MYIDTYIYTHTSHFLYPFFSFSSQLTEIGRAILKTFTIELRVTKIKYYRKYIKKSLNLQGLDF